MSSSLLSVQCIPGTASITCSNDSSPDVPLRWRTPFRFSVQESQAEELVAELTEVVRRQKAKIEALQKEREEAEPRRGVRLQMKQLTDNTVLWLQRAVSASVFSIWRT